LQLAGIALLGILWIGGTGLSFELSAICPVISVSEAPELDGKTDEAVWRNAYPMSGFVVLGNPDVPAAKPTVFRAVYTADALFVAVKCREPDMDKLQTATQAICRVDSIEIFVQPKADGPYWQMIVSSNGGREEYRDKENIQDISFWDAKVCRGTDFYSMEVKLPFTIFGARPVSNAGWRFNVARNTTTPNSDRSSTWSPLESGFHEPERFGEIVFFESGMTMTAVKKDILIRQYAVVDAWITAYKNRYTGYDAEFHEQIGVFLREKRWEEVREAAKSKDSADENVARAGEALTEVVRNLPGLDRMRSEVLKKRLFF
jgi:hypothetical protein